MLKALSRVFKMLTQVNPNLVQDVDTIINAIGGMENLLETAGACATRLRLTLKDNAIVNQKALKAHGSHGVVVIDERHIQIIYDVKANTYSQEMEERRIRHVSL
ncbi:PTS glucose transporter subunit IIB [Vibrio campbellii]|uniref:PTS transporter subunit EIIB n=1 Tax=Vibrio campbellii TaxID=680 RepID=UPI000CF41B61|nr:PTS transporter subunit EIIB [Vibrio campbellii]PQJ42538.1 PTS glucose transporter subunit IIB [Vibrio campbellii]